MLIEDEKLVARDILRLLQECEADGEVIAVLDSVEGAREWLAQHSMPDLILSDIQLADGVSFELFEGRENLCPVIFTTAFDEYAVRAFRINSIDYLLKPIQRQELVRALDKFKSLRNAVAPALLNEQFKSLLSDLKGGRKYKNRFSAHYGQLVVPVPAENVSGFVKDELIFLVTRSGQKLMTDYHALDELEELLDPAIYFRANRQYIIHLDAVTDYKTHYTGKLQLHLKGFDNNEVVVSREKAAAFRKWFE